MGGVADPGRNLPSVPARAAIEDDPVPNLYQIEKGLRELETSSGRAALTLKQSRMNLVERRRALRKAKAKAFLEAKQQRQENGKPTTVQEREAYVDINTDEEQFQFDLAEVEVRYAADLMNERSETRSSLQTRSKLAIECMRLSGVGSGL